MATTEIEQMIVGISDTVGAVEAMNAAPPERNRACAAGSASGRFAPSNPGPAAPLERIGEVASATREQSAASTAIAQRVEQIAQMVETTATIRGTAESANQLEHIAQG